MPFSSYELYKPFFFSKSSTRSPLLVHSFAFFIRSPMEVRQRIDDAYKRKLPRIKERGILHPFQCAFPSKNVKWKLCPLMVVVLIVPCVFVTFIWSPTDCHHNYTSQSFSRYWIWHASDHRYESDLEINWEEVSRALDHLPQDNRHQEVGLLNFNENEIRQWKHILPNANHTVLSLHYADENVTWESLYPEWIDEEQDDNVPSCPSLPSIEVPRRRLHLTVVKLPCGNKNWSRDIARLHIQIATARLAASYKGSTWLYKPNLSLLRQKLCLPVGSCDLALPLGESTELGYLTRKKQREAYATILHSAEMYVCGAIVAAQSIQMSGSTRDLVILVDESIRKHHRVGLEQAGWQVRTIQRIRNPKAEKDSYNEWNYSKFRLWQLIDYDKVIFIDADMLILRNIDFLFSMPEVSATGNDGQLFNSGVMVIEPSNCTFQLLMDHVYKIKSSNGGDQGYLNEIFTWWHRLPRYTNFLKHFWIGDDARARERKTQLVGAEPPELYILHYLGNKPWMCFRDYDCNWNVDRLREFASDVAHERWWRVHDAMGEGLQELCLLRTVQKGQLELDRREAESKNFSDGHWRVVIRDRRLGRCVADDRDCNWKGMLKHWIKKTPSSSSSS